MELSHQQHTLLEELIMAPKIDTSNFPNDLILPNHWNFITNPLDQTPDYSNLEIIPPPTSEFNYPTTVACSYGEFQPFLDILASPEFGSIYDNDDLPAMAETLFVDNCINATLDDSFKMETTNGGVAPGSMEIINGGRKSKSKKPDGQPSKNLMAERRRRKRLNDRLSMLRSIVPKISKMDRTSILGDTIDYTRELLDKIQKLREEEGMDEVCNDQINLIGSYLKEINPNENMQSRNPPKFDVERRSRDTRVEVCCTAKPGLLLSTLNTLDALGLDIQQCVVSCFNDFSMQASCYEAEEQRSMICSEELKQALFRNAGYGGRCL